MNKIIRNIGFLLLIFVISCGQNIDFEEVLKNEKQFELKINPNGNLILDSSLTTKIGADSKKIANLKDWFKNNPDDWESSIASWATPNIFLSSNDFRLLIFKERQYTKTVDKSEFNFLTDGNE